jgi:hypothetical protein
VFHNKRVEGILTRAEESAGVEDLKVDPSPRDRAGQRIAGRARHWGNNRAPAAGYPVEKRGFSNVRAADEDDRRAFTGHSDVHLASALTA